MRKLDLIGMRFTRLLVLREGEKRGRHRYWEVVCDCGNVKQVAQDSLKTGSSKSCGCLRKEITSSTFTKHGMSGDKFWMSWYDMVSRCHNEGDSGYSHYGGKGISVCDEWRSFENFYKDMYPTYEKGMTIERKDVLKDYFKNNCEWVSKKQQQRNTGMRSNNTTGVKGVCKTIKGCYVATWSNLDGRQRTKTFSIKKYGDELAFFLACEKRELEIQRLNLKGAGYRGFHLVENCLKEI